MGIRTNVDLTLQAGRENDLAKVAFEDDLSQLLDTLEHEKSGTLTIPAGGSNVAIDFGGVVQARLVYLRANGPFRVTPGGGLATSAKIDGVAGSYPTGFTGVNQNLDFKVDGVALSAAFQAGDQSLAQVINRINAAAALAGVTGPGGVPVTVARTDGGTQLRLISSTTGVGSTVEVLSSSAAAVLTALGLTAHVVAGVNASAGQTPLTCMQPANTTASDSAAGVVAFLFATLLTSALTVDNLDPDNDIELTYFLAGDLTSSPPADCGC